MMTVMTKLLSFVIAASSAASATVLEPKPPVIASFEEYHAAYKREYKPDTEEYANRKALFMQRKASIEEQNSKESRRWTAGLNHLSDRTEAELKRLRGWIHHSAGGRRGGVVAAALLEDGRQLEHAELEQRRDRTMVTAAVTKSGEALRFARKEQKSRKAVLARSNAFGRATKEAVDWKHLESTKIKNQGGCGSCWAVASATMLEMNHEIHMNSTRTFSEQELVNCVPNPKDCGGTGGCDGATPELAMEYVMSSGLGTREATPYQGTTQQCKAQAATSFLHTSGHGGSDNEGGAALGLASWSTLPSNKALPLMNALMNGPVAASVAASQWMSYSHGVFDSCRINSIIDHSILAVGYGFQEKKDGLRENYWTIQNSWGPEWGEHGYIRLLRMQSPQEDEMWCGTDSKPEEGSACKPYPDSVTVCGMCGILYDSVAVQFDPSAASAAAAAKGAAGAAAA